MSFTEKIVVGQISGKFMHSGKVMYISCTEKFLGKKQYRNDKDPLALLKQAISTSKLIDLSNESY